MGVFDQNSLDEAELSVAPSTSESANAEETSAPVKALEADKEDTDIVADPAPKPVPAEKPKAPKAEKPVEPKVEAPEPAGEEKAVYREGHKPAAHLVNTPQKMRDYLMSFPKVTVMAPLMPGDPKDAVEIVSINGVQLNVKKGVMIELPRPFADQIIAHYNITNSIGSESLVSAKKERNAALN